MEANQGFDSYQSRRGEIWGAVALSPRVHAGNYYIAHGFHAVADHFINYVKNDSVGAQQGYIAWKADGMLWNFYFPHMTSISHEYSSPVAEFTSSATLPPVASDANTYTSQRETTSTHQSATKTKSISDLCWQAASKTLSSLLQADAAGARSKQLKAALGSAFPELQPAPTSSVDLSKSIVHTDVSRPSQRASSSINLFKSIVHKYALDPPQFGRGIADTFPKHPSSSEGNGNGAASTVDNCQTPSILDLTSKNQEYCQKLWSSTLFMIDETASDVTDSQDTSILDLTSIDQEYCRELWSSLLNVIDGHRTPKTKRVSFEERSEDVSPVLV
ncbi:hypothetical protein BJ875DRAFT_545491 [Amylocarpus encephaloides]|uniref:Uncharacterized protein n=1 Tax=Amylocarpus encephaloides TaxID=45428 RepID=A0A9P7YCB4_9HELO|nr:hypothetical protein BJ875DRAFT_545491 [Amylocarpus encephaloides]